MRNLRVVVAVEGGLTRQHTVAGMPTRPASAGCDSCGRTIAPRETMMEYSADGVYPLGFCLHCIVGSLTEAMNAIATDGEAALASVIEEGEHAEDQ